MKKMISRRNFLKAAGVSAAALGLAACGGSSSSTSASSTASSAAASGAAKGDGKVYYLNFKPEQDQAWQDLAAAYTKETGVPVTVVTAASGQYETTLMRDGKERGSHPVPGQRPCGSGKLEGLLLRSVRQPAVR